MCTRPQRNAQVTFVLLHPLGLPVHRRGSSNVHTSPAKSSFLTKKLKKLHDFNQFCTKMKTARNIRTVERISSGAHLSERPIKSANSRIPQNLLRGESLQLVRRAGRPRGWPPGALRLGPTPVVIVDFRDPENSRAVPAQI